MALDLTLGAIIVAAAIDSINPCAFGVLIFLCAYLLKVFKKGRNMLIGGFIYVAAVYVTYFISGLGILRAVRSFEISYAFYWLAATIAIIAGLLELKDYFWYGKGPSLKLLPGGAKRIHYYTKKMEALAESHPTQTLLLTIPLGFLVALVELPCTGAVYFAILGLLAQSPAQAVPYLLFYNLIFVLPLIVIVMLAYFGVAIKELEAWRTKNRKYMRLFIGLLLIALGLAMIATISIYF